MKEAAAKTKSKSVFSVIGSGVHPIPTKEERGEEEES
jgi:hypothetical protein